MNRSLFRTSVVVIVAAVLVPSNAALASAPAASLSLDEYRRQLAAISDRVDSLHDHPENAGAVAASIPDKMTVRTAAGEITVSDSDLKADLTEFAKANSEKRSRLLPLIQDYVHTLSQDTASFDRAQQAAAHDKLTAILAQREFRNLQGPNAKDVLLAKIFGWLIRILSRLGAGNAGFNWFQVVIYVIIGGALTVILVWTLRRLRGRQEESSPREIVPFAPSARSWHVWLADARSLAQQQDWRNAIHLAYWAGISFLEEHGAWKPNRARTPREYLHLVGARTAKYPPLAALTRQLERVWYGYNDADESDFNEALALLEKLGCR
jgi:Domain of unknown function (DUF4129)